MEKAFKIVRKGACMIVCYCFEEASGLKVEKSDDWDEWENVPSKEISFT